MIKVVMPQMGESIAEGTIIKWLKAAGDQVERDEPLFEITTDKVDTEVPSPASGVLKTILVAEGETVDVGATVAEVEVTDSDTTVESAQSDPLLTNTSHTDTDSNEGDVNASAHFRTKQSVQLVSFKRAQRSAGRSASSETGQSFSPAVLELARRENVTLETLNDIQGSGRGGRLTKRDVEQYLKNHADDSTGPMVSRGSAASPPAEYIYQPKPEDERVPMTPIRRKIAKHMSWSTKISPHATAMNECDMSHVKALIERDGEQFAATAGAPLTYTVLVGEAVIKALEEFPALNASVVGDDIVLKPAVNLSVAVALPDTGELIVPVIHGANVLSRVELASAIKDLAIRARSRQLKPEDVQGGTFTLTNPGVFGGLTGTPIINQPQVAILGLGAVVNRPVVVDDSITIRPIMMLSLAFDHRAVDGMLAFQYLASVKQQLEQLT
jgi:2-oxoglutarate dehydrogenase E2 component (dihydrolipoamide succinyltransferase)|tara:strand:- start:829 stop:2151 length:1323 start_codon:yes stop_codon:yes gene_type:complete